MFVVSAEPKVSKEKKKKPPKVKKRKRKKGTEEEDDTAELIQATDEKESFDKKEEQLPTAGVASKGSEAGSDAGEQE